MERALPLYSDNLRTLQYSAFLPEINSRDSIATYADLWGRVCPSLTTCVISTFIGYVPRFLLNLNVDAVTQMRWYSVESRGVVLGLCPDRICKVWCGWRRFTRTNSILSTAKSNDQVAVLMLVSYRTTYIED